MRGRMLLKMFLEGHMVWESGLEGLDWNDLALNMVWRRALYEHSYELSGCKVGSNVTGRSARRILLCGAIHEQRESSAVYECMCTRTYNFCSVWYRGAWFESPCLTLLSLSSDRYVEYVIVFDPELLQFIFKHVDLLLELTSPPVRSLFMAGMYGDWAVRIG